ncbi:metal-dependent transcriptional regulator [Propionimicrobium sp. PCR01-08-3]|uniref:metal-dependent transcriptional regulator n=1 Tax=Propionimicrobium sp. PCR01-08-3 TaxID=3052086 RepID=UPI00255C2E41|nr:metal-dependent transcriptional regulator [Propionimicrobium sp. PCR01-08-3]WIY81720.1 metal-dependent transcriptional regulator [Propionimicrobium sp. PCR01-08-3]
MSVSALSASTQNYLKVIWGLQEWTDGPVTTTDIAEKMQLKVSTVSDGVRKLADQGLVKHARYGDVELTPEGRAHALAMVRRHRLIETFLVQVLHYRWDQVHDEAEQMEHAVSDMMIERLDELLEHPVRDPHGDPIPAPDGAVHQLDAFPMGEAPHRAPAKIERISDDDPEFLKYLADHRIGVGTELEIQEGAPFSGGIEIRSKGSSGPVVLGREASNAIWVSLLR